MSVQTPSGRHGGGTDGRAEAESRGHPRGSAEVGGTGGSCGATEGTGSVRAEKSHAVRKGTRDVETPGYGIGGHGGDYFSGGEV